MYIEILGLLLAVLILFWRRKSKKLPLARWYIPNLSLIEIKESKIHIWPILSHALGLSIIGLLVLALINPSLPLTLLMFNQKQPLPRDGRVITLIVDVSGSMVDPFGTTTESKISVAKKIATDLVQSLSAQSGNRQNIFGLSSLARTCFVDCPLTYDKKFLIEQIQKLQPITYDSMNGTALGYALFKTTEQILATQAYAKEIKAVSIPIDSEAVVIISDGINDPHPLDKQDPFRWMSVNDALGAAREAGIRVYFISVEPNGDAEYNQELNSMAALIENTKGRLFKAGPNLSIEQVVQSINELEAAHLPPVSNAAPDTISVRWFFAAIAAILTVLKLWGDFLVSRGCT